MVVAILADRLDIWLVAARTPTLRHLPVAEVLHEVVMVVVVASEVDLSATTVQPHATNAADQTTMLGTAKLKP